MAAPSRLTPMTGSFRSSTTRSPSWPVTRSSSDSATRLTGLSRRTLHASMLILLPPSETKRDGGAEGSSLDLGRLSFPELAGPRRSVSSELRKLSSNLTTMAAALKLGTGQQHELLRNRAVRTSPTMPAIDRYTGVLYDALDAQSLPSDAREFAARHVAVHSALFG